MTRFPITALLVVTMWPLAASAQTVPQGAPPPASQAPPVVQSLFRADSKVGFVDLERIFNNSAFGRDGLAKVVALRQTLADGLNARGREIQALSERIKTQQQVVAPTIWLQWNTDLARLQREAQFAEQEAQIQVDQMQQSLLAGFEALVQPVIESVRTERNLWAVFALQPQDSAGSLTLVAADPAIDLSAEVTERLNRRSESGISNR